MTPDVLIVGGGLAGLCCGRELARRGISFQILEASDGVGGRVRTDVVDGFRLDRGLQNYLDSYPEGKRVLDYAALNLKPFTRAVRVWFGGQFHRLADPREELLTAVASAFSPVGTLGDKLAAVKLKAASAVDPATAPDGTTLDFLRANGVGERMTDRLFRPFLGGVFLEKGLTTSARFARFIYHLFGEGHPTVPALGVQQIPDQIAAGLPAGSIRLNCPVAGIDVGQVSSLPSPVGQVSNLPVQHGKMESCPTVSLASGERLTAKAVVIATDGPAAVTLCGGAVPPVGSNGSTTLYYAAAKPPAAGPVLMLDGEGAGPVNSLAVMSEVSREYAPDGQALIAASVVGIPAADDAELDRTVRGQLGGWFGADVVGGWRLLRVYRIRHALPSQPVGALEPWERSVRLRTGLFVCGDHRDNASINGAMVSGRRAAEAVAGELA
jgi:phytoene dehydrogenase-like protein